jgi:hypothetical protein
LQDIFERPLYELTLKENDVMDKVMVTECNVKEKKRSENVCVFACGAKNECFPSCAPFKIDQAKYSSVTKLLRVTAYVKRAIGKMKRKTMIHISNINRNSRS